MKQNKYDNDQFFSAYKSMPRSTIGLEAAGEWHIVKELIPDLQNKDVLDLGCGFGWHCRYAREKKANSVIGIDISEKMLQQAIKMTNDSAISYIEQPIEDIRFNNASFDVVFSSLALHYVKDYQAICNKVFDYLKPSGAFLFSVEHPIFTAREEQDWYYDQNGQRLHWPVDLYHTEGIRQTSFLADNVIKYHRTISTYINGLIAAGFSIKAVEESTPSEEMLPDMQDELRRPMFLIILADKI
ncbi:class I SAM-dependent methyltransferase [Gracilibacillus saliphilus]|uniref:class I SAM-dependent methyltransferase n=1 Tax=Gracilibacillus saliphilus TaxID=543890 RepID=UPI0013D6B542|nr:class I SAM-dependent methyltransferase [Gracilibacillus saliphilus]